MRERQRLELTCDPPKKIGENWSVKATAILSLGERTLSGEAINFFVNSELASSATTDEDGRATEDLVIPAGATSASIEAQLAGSPARARKIVSLPVAIRRPAKIEAKAIGRDGKYNIICQVVSDQGIGIQAELLLVDETTQETKKIETDTDGYLEHALEFQEHEKRITILVLKTDIDVRLRLPGPRVKPKITPPTAKELEGSWREIWQRGRERRKQK